jgi:hypothetical protein
MAKKKKIMLTDPIDADNFGKENNIIIPKDFKSMKAEKYTKYTKKNTKKQLTLMEKIKNFISKFTLR